MFSRPTGLVETSGITAEIRHMKCNLHSVTEVLGIILDLRHSILDSDIGLTYAATGYSSSVAVGSYRRTGT